MARTANPEIAERDKEIVQSYLDGDTVAAIKRDYGMSEANVWRILNAAGGVKKLGPLRRVREDDEKSPDTDKDLNLIGSNISYIVSMLQITPVNLQLAINITPARLLKIERGEALDLTLIELRRLADYFGYSLVEFLELRNSVGEDMSAANVIARFNKRHGRIPGENAMDSAVPFQQRRRAG